MKRSLLIIIISFVAVILAGCSSMISGNTPLTPPQTMTQKGSTSLTLVSVTSPIASGGQGTITIKTNPNTEVALSIQGSVSQGLVYPQDIKISDSNGIYSWIIGSKSSLAVPGYYRVTVSAGNISELSNRTLASLKPTVSPKIQADLDQANQNREAVLHEVGATPVPSPGMGWALPDNMTQQQRDEINSAQEAVNKAQAAYNTAYQQSVDSITQKIKSTITIAETSILLQ